jgi:hypothetical protein
MATSSDPGRNLLFGVLALQLNFFTREALMAATSSKYLTQRKALVNRSDPVYGATMPPSVTIAVVSRKA